MQTSALFDAKKLKIFFNLRCVYTEKGERSIFRDFVRTSFMDGSLLIFFKFSPLASTIKFSRGKLSKMYERMNKLFLRCIY